jgi:hypothetical protein
MKSFVLGFSTLLALATPAISSAQTQVDFNVTEDSAATDGSEWNQDGAYVPPSQEAMPQAAMPQAASSFGYFGPHPVPYDQGSGFCQHSGAHEHPYPVFDRNLFRVSNGYAYFVGDPSDFGYQNQAYAYRAEHPIADTFGGGYCYMHWAHRHWFQPASVDFNWDGGAYTFVGSWAPSYYVNRPYWTNYFNSYYRPWYLGGAYYTRRPTQVYGGLGWHRPVYGYGGWNRGPVYGGPVYRNPYGGWNRGPIYRGPMVQPRWTPPVYNRGPVYQAPGYRPPMYRPPVVQQAPAYRPPVYQQAPAYRGGFNQAPAYRAPMYQAPAYRGGFNQAPAYRGGGFSQAPAYRGGGFSQAPVYRGGGFNQAPAYRAGGFGRR